MISEVVVMNIAGQPLFRKAYDPQASQVDPGLSSGLITAVYHFTNQVRGEAIKMMELAGAKVCFDERQGLLIVVTVERRLPDQDALDIVQAVGDAWLARFASKDPGLVDTKEFEGFEPIVDEIIDKNLWWLREGQRFSIRNQFKYMREIAVRPSRSVGSEYLSNNFFLLPLLFFFSTITISYVFGSQIVNLSIDFIWQSSPRFLIVNLINIGALWILLPLIGSILNGKLDKYRSTVLSMGYLLVFWIPLMLIASRTYLLAFGFGNPYGYDLLFPPAEAYTTYLAFMQTEVPMLNYYALWVGPMNGLFFYWLFLYAYSAYNIQRPNTPRFLASTILSLITVWVLQTILYTLILEGAPIMYAARPLF